MGLGFTQQLSQYLSIPCVPLPPANRAGNTTVNITTWAAGPLDMAIYRRAMGLLNVGAILGAGAPNTVNIQFLAGNTTNALQAITGAAWNWANISGGPTASIAGNNNAATIEVRADQLPAGQRYLALIVNNNSAAFFDAWLIGAEAAYEPGGIGNVAVVLNTGVGQLNTAQGLTQSVM